MKKRGWGTCAACFVFSWAFPLADPASTWHRLHSRWNGSRKPTVNHHYPRCWRPLVAECNMSAQWSLGDFFWWQLSLHPRFFLIFVSFWLVGTYSCMQMVISDFLCLAISNCTHILCCITNVETHAIKSMSHRQEGECFEIWIVVMQTFVFVFGKLIIKIIHVHYSICRSVQLQPVWLKSNQVWDFLWRCRISSASHKSLQLSLSHVRENHHHYVLHARIAIRSCTPLMSYLYIRRFLYLYIRRIKREKMQLTWGWQGFLSVLCLLDKLLPTIAFADCLLLMVAYYCSSSFYHRLLLLIAYCLWLLIIARQAFTIDCWLLWKPFSLLCVCVCLDLNPQWSWFLVAKYSAFQWAVEDTTA